MGLMDRLNGAKRRLWSPMTVWMAEVGSDTLVRAGEPATVVVEVRGESDGTPERRGRERHVVARIGAASTQQPSRSRCPGACTPTGRSASSPPSAERAQGIPTTLGHTDLCIGLIRPRSKIVELWSCTILTLVELALMGPMIRPFCAPPRPRRLLTTARIGGAQSLEPGIGPLTSSRGSFGYGHVHGHGAPTQLGRRRI